MTILKTDTLSHTATSELSSKHYEVGNRIAEILSPLSLDLKIMVANKLPEIVADAKREMALRDGGEITGA